MKMGLMKRIGQKIGGWVVNSAKNAYQYGRKIAPVAFRFAQTLPGYVGTVARVAGSAADTMTKLTEALGKGRISDVVKKGANMATQVRGEAEGLQVKANEALNKAGQLGSIVQQGVKNVGKIL